jgi:hypothetical protein
MVDFPTTLDEAIAQAQHATQAALAAGYTRVQVEFLLPEFKSMTPARQYLSVFEDLGAHLKIFFTDAGSAALAKRDWSDVAHEICSVDIAGARQTTTAEDLLSPEDQVFVFIAPSSVEVSLVEQISTLAGERPIILFAPQLEDIGTVGVGYTARKIRERFLNLFEPCYYLRPLAQAAVLRCYPSPWQVWLDNEDRYTLVAEEPLKPDSERLATLLIQAGGTEKSSKPGFLAQMQMFLKALGQ